VNIFQRISARARGKDLAAQHPETTTREHLMSVRSDAQMLAPYSYLDALVANENHVWVMKGVKIICDNAAPLPLYVQRGAQRIDKHDALKLLNNPNEQHSAAELWRWWCTDMLLGGEEGWELVHNGHGRIGEIWPRQPHVFGVMPDPKLKRYYVVDHYEIDDKQGEPYSLNPDEFMHYKFFNPRNPWRGVGPLLALRMSIAIDVFAQAWEKFLFVNNARPDYAVVAPQGTTRGEREDIEKKIYQKHGGVQNAGKVIALEEGITDIKILSFRPKDLGELELRKFSRDEIAGGLGVPDILAGFGNDTYDNEVKRTAAIVALYSLTIKPLLGFRDGKLTKDFRRLGLLADNEELFTDYSGVAELQEAADAEWKRDKERIAGGHVTINEYNENHGLKKQPWGDVWWAPANLVPVGGAGMPAPQDKDAPALTPSQAQAMQLLIGETTNPVTAQKIQFAEFVSAIAVVADVLAHYRGGQGVIDLPPAASDDAPDDAQKGTA
jgi:HK97 family phage portal protein